MRRLYSTFAGGWPGTGLLLMRLVIGSVLVVRAGLRLWGDPPLNVTITAAILGFAGILLMLGLWTPIVGTSVAVIEAWKVLTLPGDRWLWLLLGTVSAALAMLGPGRWSIDARLFGWKRVEAPPRKSSSIPRSKLPKQPNFLAQKRVLLASQEVAICPHVGLCAKCKPVHNCAHQRNKSFRSRFKPTGLNKRSEFRVGGVMYKIENFQESAEHCFEVASSQNLLEEDVALEAFELLTANQYDYVLAHGLGVSL